MQRALLFSYLFVFATMSVCANEDGTDDGFVSLFNGKDLSRWVNMGKAEGWKIKDGVIRSEGGDRRKLAAF